MFENLQNSFNGMFGNSFKNGKGLGNMVNYSTLKDGA